MKYAELSTPESNNPAHASVVDLFCGVGGLTSGLIEENLRVSAGIDFDEECRYAYEFNNAVPFVKKDVAVMSPVELNELFIVNLPKVLVGCAPCQPFSAYNAGRHDERWALLERFAELIDGTRPDVVSMENVPRLLNYKEGAVLENFIKRLETSGYHVWTEVVCAADYGVPQRRNRLVLLGSLHGPIKLEEPKLDKDSWVTVKEAIGNMDAIKAGGVAPTDPLHKSSSLSDLNMRRIRAAKPGGTWREWDEKLVTPCHNTERGKSYISVYGRMGWDQPAPTITTQFFGFGNGRFGHPTQNRAISLREGAILQSFPPDYRFTPAGDSVRMKTVGRMIGNAVPVLLGRAIGRTINSHLTDMGLA